MTVLDLERRNVSRPVELRAAGSGGPGTLFGYAAVYNRYSQNLGGFVEQVAPGAFAKTLADGNPVIARYNHSDDFLLGTTDAGTLRLLPDDIGLPYEVDLPNTGAGNDTAELARRGDVRSSSFAFNTIEDDWTLTEQGFPLRTLISVRLIDVAPTHIPAYLDATAGMRSLASKLDVEVDVVAHATTEELRSLLTGGHIDIPAVEARGEEQKEEIEQAQGDTHVPITLRQKQLDLLKSR